MKGNCNFQMNPAFFTGAALMCACSFLRHVLEVGGAVGAAAHFLGGSACGLILVGLLYGSPKTRPLFDRFYAFKQRLLGR